MPEILNSDAEAGLFAMEYLDGFQNWKDELLKGDCDVELARKAGELLGEIHRRSWGDPDILRRLITYQILISFVSIRICATRLHGTHV